MNIEKEYTRTAEQFKQLLFVARSEDEDLYKMLLFVWAVWLNSDQFENFQKVIDKDYAYLYPSEKPKSSFELSTLDSLFEELLGDNISKQIENKNKER